jgi:hypothetical protein
MSVDQPHLPVISDECGVTVGPLVVPGEGPCMICMGIKRAERDPDWPMVALQCNGARSPIVPATVRAITAGVACDAVSRFLFNPQPESRQWRIECAPVGGPSVREAVATAHPSCRCANTSMRGDYFENLQAVLL